MSFIFPEDKADFTAANGITYSWDVTGEKWVVKSYKSTDGDFLPLTGGTLTGRTTINKVREDTNSIAFSIAGRIRNNDGAVEPDILLKSYQRNEADTQPDYLAYYGSGGGANEVLNRTTAQDEFADKTIVDDALEVQAAIQEQQETQAGELVSLQNQIDELATEKGTPARFTIASNTGELATRNGEMSVANADPEQVNAISFGVADLDGNPPKEKAVGDILELVDVATNRSARYTITGADGSPTLVQVAYLDGNNTFDVGDEELVFVYPQNEASVSKEYVDDQLALKINKAGDDCTGYLDFKGERSGARFFRNDTKLFSVWDFDTAETRARIEADTTFKLTGYQTGDETERQLIKWDSESLYIYKLADPADDDNAVSLGYANSSYLKLTGGTMEGQLHVQIEPEWEDSATSKAYVDNLAATNLALVWAQNYATEEYVDNAIGDFDPGEDINLDELDERYFKLTGGTIDGLTTISFTEATADNSYVFNVQGSRLPEGQTSAFRVTAGGSVKAGHDINSPFIATAANDVVTKAYADIEYALSMKRFGNNDVATGAENEERIFRIRGIRDDENRFTCVSINNESMGLYNVRPPEAGHHAANRDYVDEQIEDAPFLPLAGGTLSDRLFFERRSGMNMIISPNASDTSSSIYACNGGAIRFRSLPGTDVNASSTHIAIGKEENGDPGTYIYHLHDPEDELWAANKRYVDREVQRAIDGFSSSERFYEVKRGQTPVAQSVTFYEASGFFYYFIDVRPMTGRTIGNPANFAFKDCALPFKMGWIQSNGAENIMVSAVATLVRKTTVGSGHYFQIAVDPTRDDALIHDPYTVPQGSTVVISLAGLI